MRRSSPPTACYLHDSENFLRKWLRDVMADQREDGAIAHVVPDPTRLHPEIFANFAGSTGWGDAICVVPWTLWLHYGDRSVLEETLPAMEKWVDYVWSISDGPIVRPPRHRHQRGFTFGDWLQPGGPTEKPLPTCGDDMAATLYLYISSVLTAKAAEVVGNQPIAAAHVQARGHCEEGICGRVCLIKRPSRPTTIRRPMRSQFCTTLFPRNCCPAAIGYFKAAIGRCDGRIGTGFIGTPALLPALIKIGEHELAAKLFLQEEAPGWLYQVKTRSHDDLGAMGRDPAGWQHASLRDELLQSLRLWRGLPVAVRSPSPAFGRIQLSPGFKSVIFEPTIIPALVTGLGAVTIPPPAASRRRGRSKATG